MKVEVFVTLKAGVLDPQGQAVGGTLRRLGFDAAKDVRIGKYIELEVDAPTAEAAKENVDAMCRELLANTVMENYRIEVREASE